MDDIEPVDVVVRDDDGGWREVTLRVRDSGVRVAELAGALGAPGAGVTVDGREVAPATPIVTSGLRRGSIVTRRGVRSTLAAPPAGALRWTGGVDAGRAHRLAAGVTVIGRAPSVNLRCRDPQVAPFHCLVRSGPAGIAVQPLVPAAELVAGNRWRIGARHAELLLPSPPAPSVPTGPVRPGEWTAGLSRPPRPAPAPMPAAVRAPASDRRGGHGSPGAAPIVGAVVAAFGSVAAAMIFGQPALLLLGGLGALGSVGSWLFQRRSGARAARAGRRLARVELAAFDAALGDQAAAAAACRWARAVELTDAVERARHHDSRLWERRRHHPDHLDVVIGVGAVPWYPIVDRLPDEPPAAALAVMAGHDRLEPAPVSLGLRAGVVLGIVGDAPAARSLARALVVQAAVTSGPADLAIGVRADGPAWEWARWLPHSLGPDEETGDRTRLVVVDCSGPVVARAELTGRFGPVAGIVMAPDIVGLPSCCTHVATVDGVATVSLHDVADGSTIEGIVGAGASVSTAAGVARALARYDDPELAVAGRGLPAAIDLGDLLGATALDGPALASAWRELGPDRGLRAPIGRSEDGVFEIDLVEHGPHTLIAGTTGAGKSELLRTLVAGLAARSSPRDLTFVLIDYKGGSAFDACASFPHVGGVVTDLDDRLAARALRGLDAELRRRERRLREAGATDIGDARRRGLELPRLVVVVDEMAGLAADLPDFLHALVDVAQRGRSLGLHLVLATQRPAGVVSDDIRANTNLRIALRMQSPAESHDVLGRPDAASLRAERPGRAFVRVGPAEPVAVQVAMVSGTGVAAARPAVEVLPIGTVPVAPAAGVGSSTLERLAAAARAAAAELGVAAARAPWLEPLPDVLVLDDLPAGASALADDPDRQEQRPVWWCRPDGNLLCTGIAGSGASAAVVAVAAAAASRSAAADLHLYAVDMGAGALAPLASLPHCAGVLGAGERERQVRLVRRLQREVDQRRAGATGPDVVLVVDGLPAWRAAFDDPSAFAVLDALDRIVTDGLAVGVFVAATADRLGALPAAVLNGFGRRWCFREADGLPLPSGRAVDSTTGLDLQVAVPRRSWTEVADHIARHWPPGGGPAPLGVLPRSVASVELPVPTRDGARWIVPVGIADADDLGPAALVLHPGDHAFVGGRSRTGRSSALALLAERFRAAQADVLVAAVALRPSPLLDCGAELMVTDPVGLPMLGVLRDGRRPALLLVDDAERVDDDGTLASLVAGVHPRLHVVAAGRPDVVRSLYGHWTAAVRRSRLGVLLQADVDVDGDLLGAVLPRRQPVAAVPGRGHLVVDGRPEVVQLALPANMGP